jgi:glucosylceramidase
MVLDKQGGPNWFKNWCIAPVIVDPDNDEVYFTPLYYTMAHFSKYMRPGAKVIDVDKPDLEKFMVTAAINPDNSIAVVIFNEEPVARDYTLVLNEKSVNLHIDGQAIQSIVIPPSNE